MWAQNDHGVTAGDSPWHENIPLVFGDLVSSNSHGTLGSDGKPYSGWDPIKTKSTPSILTANSIRNKAELHYSACLMPSTAALRQRPRRECQASAIATQHSAGDDQGPHVAASYERRNLLECVPTPVYTRPLRLQLLNNGGLTGQASSSLSMDATGNKTARRRKTGRLS